MALIQILRLKRNWELRKAKDEMDENLSRLIVENETCRHWDVAVLWSMNSTNSSGMWEDRIGLARRARYHAFECRSMIEQAINICAAPDLAEAHFYHLWGEADRLFIWYLESVFHLLALPLDADTELALRSVERSRAPWLSAEDKDTMVCVKEVRHQKDGTSSVARP